MHNKNAKWVIDKYSICKLNKKFPTKEKNILLKFSGVNENRMGVAS